MPRMEGFPRVVWLWIALVAGCAAPVPPGGTPEAEVLRQRGEPTARHPLPDGGVRLEYAGGTWARQTWMIDLDAQRRVRAVQQVLTEGELLRVQQAVADAAGLEAAALRRWLGTPGERRGAHLGGEVWSWRYETHDCLWFQASLDPMGRVRSAAFATDPACDGGADRD